MKEKLSIFVEEILKKLRLQVLLRDRCVDARALQALREEHLHGLQGKHKQAIYAKNQEWYSGSSSSSGRQGWKASGSARS